MRWVLNLDADLELEAIAAGKKYQPSTAVIVAMAPHVARLATSLLEPGDAVVVEPSRGRGMAFCPTPRARALLELDGPSADVLCKVNSRAFCASLGQTLPGAAFFTDPEEALRTLAHGRWRVKRAFGMAGRGQRVVDGLTDLDRAFVRASIGGVQIEPQLTIERELAIHGFIDDEIRIGVPMRQTCDARGQWQASEPAASEPFASRLVDEAHLVAGALIAGGYFGPFGVDAFVYAGGFQPRSEINARYSMGYPRVLVQRRELTT